MNPKPFDLDNLKDLNEDIKEIDPTVPYCKFCEKETTLRLSGDEYVCKYCGFVFEEKTIYSECSSVKLHATEDQPLYDNTPNVADYKNNFGKSVNSNLIKSLKRTIQKTKLNTSYSRSKMKGLYEIERLSNVLDLNKQTEIKITEKFLEFNKKSVFKNKNMHSCIAALTSIICNRTQVPLSITEILKQTSVPKTKFNMDFFYLMHLFETPGPTCAPTRAHLKKYLSFISSWDQEQIFNETLKEILDKTKVLDKEGREGIVGVASIIYILLKYYQYPFCDVMLKHLIINRLTIKNAWKLMVQEYPELEIYTMPSRRRKNLDDIQNNDSTISENVELEPEI